MINIGDMIKVTDIINNKVDKNDVQALHSNDALRISGDILYLYKGNGENESVTLPKATPQVNYEVGSFAMLERSKRTGSSDFSMVYGSTCSGNQLCPGGLVFKYNNPMDYTPFVIDDDNLSPFIGSRVNVGTWKWLGGTTPMFYYGALQRLTNLVKVSSRYGIYGLWQRIA